MSSGERCSQRMEKPAVRVHGFPEPSHNPPALKGIETRGRPRRCPSRRVRVAQPARPEGHRTPDLFFCRADLTGVAQLARPEGHRNLLNHVDQFFHGVAHTSPDRQGIETTLCFVMISAMCCSQTRHGAVRRAVTCRQVAVTFRSASTCVRRSSFPDFRVCTELRAGSGIIVPRTRNPWSEAAWGALPEPGPVLTAAWYRCENGHHIRRSARVFLVSVANCSPSSRA